MMPHPHFRWLFSLLFSSSTFLLSAQQLCDGCSTFLGAVTRGDTSQKALSLVFTGDSFAEGGDNILKTLDQYQVKASFFLTGNFYRNPDFSDLIRRLKKQGHYLGAHSDRHLLYCDWTDRDSLLVTKAEFLEDLRQNYREMNRFGIRKKAAPYYLPPFEWYNARISEWTRQEGLQLINYTPGTRSHADYTPLQDKNYRSTEVILNSIYDYEATHANGLNGFILLVHIGAGPDRPDPLHERMGELLQRLSDQGYQIVPLRKLLR